MLSVALKATGLRATVLAACVGLAHVAAAPPPAGADGASDPTRRAGAYAALDRDDRAIAMILLLAQFKAVDRPRPNEAWSLEEIASARLRWAGWGQVFHDLYAESLVDSDSLARILAMRSPAAGDPIRPANDRR